MDPFQVLAFDPGGSTGWAHFVYENAVEYYFESGTYTNTEHHNSIRYVIQNCALDRVDKPLTAITESFEYRQDQRKGLDLVSREYIGVMKLICNDLCIPLIQQSPSIIEHYGKPHTGKGFMNYRKLDKVGQLHQPLEQNRHRHDALQHLLYYLLTKIGVEELKVKVKKVDEVHN